MISAALLFLAPLQSPAAALAPESVFDRLAVYANGRVRAESTLNPPSPAPDRHRGRMRFRLGASYELTDTVSAEARLTTVSANADANNPHWDFGDGAEGFNGADLALDRFFLDWHAAENLDVRTGQFPHVFSDPPVFGEFVWDDDVHPAGVAAVWGPGDRTGVGYDLRAAGYVAVENSADDDPAAAGLQANLYLDAGEDTDVQLSTSFLGWSSLNPGAGVLSNQGNTDPTGDFGILEGFVAATHRGGPLRELRGFLQGMHNVEDDDRGFALGCQLGTAGREGDANVFGVYYDLDANAVFSPPAQDDTPLSGTGLGTGVSGVIAGGQYFVTDDLSIRLWALSSDARQGDPLRLRLDIDFKVR